MSRRSLLRSGSLLAVAGGVGGALTMGTGSTAYASPRLRWHRIAAKRPKEC